MLTAEFLGSAALAVVVIGSGIAAASLSPGAVGLQLLENALVTGAGLYALITVLGPISGAHLNPVVTAVLALRRGTSRALALAEVPVQVLGCSIGAVLANVTFARATFEVSTHHRASGPHLLAEVLATATLLVVICVLAETGRGHLVAGAVAATIAAAYFAASSTSFANPAITVGRMWSNSFAGIAPASVPGFIAAQVVGALFAVLLLHLLLPRTVPSP